MTIEEYAKERLEQRLEEDVKGMNWEQRKKYLSSVATYIDEMLKIEPYRIGLLDEPLSEDEGFFRT